MNATAGPLAHAPSSGFPNSQFPEPTPWPRHGQRPERQVRIEPAQQAALVGRAPARSASYHRTKRIIDVVLASTLLVIFAPVIALIALLVRLDSKGPALFRQPRLGIGLQEFEFCKFRTMVVDARDRFPEYYAYQFDDGEAQLHQFKTAVDPRLTRVGRFIRRTSLDELPNLINVLKGDMSMVGPRPEIPEMLPYYRPEELCKFGVLPGVTGLAQISGRNMLLWAQTNAHDVEYVHTRSLRGDLSIMVKTVVAVVGMVGAL